MNFRRETAVSVISACVTVAALIAFGVGLARDWPGASAPLRPALEVTVFIVAISLQASGNLIYMFARFGFLRRRGAFEAEQGAVLERIHQRAAPRLGILIPSYKEERQVLLQTLLSAALLEYPRRRVVLLLDDPPDCTGADLAALHAARALARDLDHKFGLRAQTVEHVFSAFRQRIQADAPALEDERATLAQQYRNLADWLDHWSDVVAAGSTPATAHTDRHFIELILRRPAEQHRARAALLCGGHADASDLTREYQRLLALVRVQVESFERKRYVNLSHEPNKAMNLNSYIGLIGGTHREERRADGLWLVEAAAHESTWRAAEVEFVLTIDADSFVLPDYALRLIQVMESRPDVAVAQTPYSAVPGAPGTLERVAGATTDIQYLVHQGFTYYNATYWVGANALLRLAALRDIRTWTQERGHRMPVFIQDRTVIEDTGSTVDLISRGWALHNYPERLAYSATPPDFGALIIQRRRWANGGLIILPDLLRYLWAACRPWRVLPEAAMRVYYLCSPMVASVILLTLLLYRFDDSLANLWLPVVALPYFLVYGRDLRLAGYAWADLPRVYALNLLLLPVNMAGVLQSLQQLALGRKAPFGRTPKVQFRTVVAPIYLVFHAVLVAYLACAAVLDVVQGYYAHAGFALASVGFITYAFGAFVGWCNSWTDLRDGVAARLQRRSARVATRPTMAVPRRPRLRWLAARSARYPASQLPLSALRAADNPPATRAAAHSDAGRIR